MIIMDSFLGQHNPSNYFALTEKIKKVRKIGKKERVQEENIMIKVLFICHGRVNGLLAIRG